VGQHHRSNPTPEQQQGEIDGGVIVHCRQSSRVLRFDTEFGATMTSLVMVTPIRHS